jgi:SAM-dependent methyltransferase
MHLTAEQNVKRFFDVYVQRIQTPIKIVEIGACIGGFNIRSLNPSNAEYIGVDIHQVPGVDIVLDDPYILPFDDNSIDFVISSSCFEHSEFFWLNFTETMRILKPSGVFYLNAPSNGAFHRFPVDCWRFFPDSGNALVNWGKRNGYNCELLEQYTSDKGSDIWSDYVAVFIKDIKNKESYPYRMIQNFKDFTNGSIYPHSEIINPLFW